MKKTGKRERIERALNFEIPDRVPYTDSFQHAGLIHYFTDRMDSPSWTTIDVIKPVEKVAVIQRGCSEIVTFF